MIPHLIYSLGALICALNFYVSILRRPLNRLTAIQPAKLRQISKAPILGTLLISVAWIQLSPHPHLTTASIIFILLDTGGPHYLIAFRLCKSLRQAWNHEPCRG